MRLAMRLPPKKGAQGTQETAVDPREQESAEVIDLASRASFPAITDRRSKTEGLGLAAGVAIVFGLGAVTLWSMNAARLQQAEPVGNPEVAPPQAASPAVEPAPIDPDQPAPAPAPQRSDPAPAPVLAAAPQPATNPYASPTVIYDASRAVSNAGALPIAGTIGAPASREEGGLGAGGSAGEFASRIGGVGGGPAQASRLVNPSTTVTQGTLIPAILETAINTDVPGFVRAVVSQDVRSFDGKRVLVPRSSRLVGQYQSGVQQGQRRAYVIWTRLIRPDGVSVNLGSPAVAFDGTTGLEGDVNSHFFKRFGSAMLLSVVGGLGAVATGGVGGVILAGGAQNAASQAVQSQGQISPTIRVRMGEPIRVFTARDLDFSTVSN